MVSKAVIALGVFAGLSLLSAGSVDAMVLTGPYLLVVGFFVVGPVKPLVDRSVARGALVMAALTGWLAFGVSNVLATLGQGVTDFVGLVAGSMVLGGPGALLLAGLLTGYVDDEDGPDPIRIRVKK